MEKLHVSAYIELSFILYIVYLHQTVRSRELIQEISLSKPPTQIC